MLLSLRYECSASNPNILGKANFVKGTKHSYKTNWCHTVSQHTIYDGAAAPQQQCSLEFAYSFPRRNKQSLTTSVNQLEYQAAIDYTPANATETVYRFEPVHYTQGPMFPVYKPMYGVLRVCHNFHFVTIYLAKDCCHPAIKAAQK